MAAPSPPRGRLRSFGFVVAGLGAFTLTASSSAPSPLYPVYQQMWGFSAATLTVVFAVYVLALLAALVTVGSLSDHVGRRPVIVTALLVLAASMFVFVASPGVEWLMVARILQGLAVGAATSAVAAAVIEMQPTAHSGSLVNTAAPSLGLALGAAGAGVLVQFAPFPTVLSYAVVAALALTLAVALVFVPETSPSVGFPSRRDALRSLIPSASVPREVRGRYLLILPSLMSAWGLGGLYMSLGPSIVDTVFGVDNRLAAGLVIATLFTSGTLAATTMARRDPHRVVVAGAVLLATGLAVVITALLTGWVAVYYVGTAVAGFGWGSTFVGAMSVVGSLGRADERGRIFAATFVICYFAFSVPAMAAGVAAGSFGLTSTAVGYGVVVAVLALVAGAGVLMRTPKPDSVRAQTVPAPIRS
ncbi:MFS transporter [Rhodococcus sp. NPDC047139]|uniref:MFS transporter n=1 Tax=Rhodococcus sp. NPDC047139 TaxID=3155141 RepID=UPI0033C97563